MTLTFDRLTLKVVSESRVTLATSVPILVFLGLSVLELGPMYATDRQTDRRQTYRRQNAVRSAIDRFSCCLEVVEAWMTASRLRLNTSKTQVMWLGSRHNLDRVTVSEVQVLTSTVRVVSSALSLTAG